MYKILIRHILYLLSIGDAERAHTLARRAVQVIQKVPGALAFIETVFSMEEDVHPTVVAGITFPNRIGLAAGLDKQGEMLPFMQAIGFGFATIGTVLPRPQIGNDCPRYSGFGNMMRSAIAWDSTVTVWSSFLGASQE